MQELSHTVLMNSSWNKKYFVSFQSLIKKFNELGNAEDEGKRLLVNIKFTEKWN